MDPSLATDAYPYHHHHLQQQQQQYHHHLQQQQPQHQQQQQQHQHQLQHHYPYNQLSLPPSSGKNLYDLDVFAHPSHISQGLGHLPTSSSSYQPDYSFPYAVATSMPYAAPTSMPTSSSATAALQFQQSNLTSNSPAQTWSRNHNNTHRSAQQSGYLAAQHSQYSPAVAATAAPAATLHPTGYNGEIHGGEYASYYGWAGHDLHRAQWSQQNWENCLPPGVEPTAAAAPISISHPNLQSNLQTQFNPQPHPFTHQFTPFGVNLRTARPITRIWPKKKNTDKIPVVKTTATKEVGTSRGSLLEKGPGWCFVCQRNCLTEAALKQHLEGKGHKRQVELQQEKAEAVAKAVDEGGGEVAAMLEQMWVQVSMMAKPVKPKKKPKAEDSRSTNVVCVDVPKKQEMVRCELCNVECNSQAILEIHFGGRKHAARLKKAQEFSVGFKAGPPLLIGPQPLLPGQT